MNFETLRRHCESLPGSTCDIKWGADEVYSVGGKMFAVFWIDKGKARSISFKCEPGRFLELTDVAGVAPAPYLARAHWVQVKDTHALTEADVQALVDRSRALVLAKLPKKVRAAIEAPESP